ncbi:MAG: P-loop containing nucleoside triphosphate hydrolase protein [Benjaminiella poitrasii]|nr:MAG: P-loop containing nucleoside triphosphate hydrolase protein [Benjaminiella poitrasii]
MYFYSIYERFGKNKEGQELERTIRSKGMGMYALCEIRGDQRYQSDRRYRVLLKGSREHHSKYNKDDVWVVSKTSSFESSQTFLARSTYFGPFSDGSLEFDCISPRDVRIASQLMQPNKPTLVYALRTISASTEFMMLDMLEERVEQLPLLPYILNKSKKKESAMATTPLSLNIIELTREDNIDVEAKIVETISFYGLNEDQERVLRQVAASVIKSPGWNDHSEVPVVLVHGVYGSGKSFLAAVVIIFIQDIIDAVSKNREPEDAIQFKILVSSMTNVAVDRILQTLLKLGFDHFVRVGSMRKIAKNILPYTAKARLSSNEELKELEQMLEDQQNSEEDTENIATAIQHFRKSESVNSVHSMNVVGTTFMSSVFEVFDNVKFPLILVDESSQLTEPLTMVPLTRFGCSRLVMIGDPLQLPPTLASNAEEGKAGQGLDKTLFDRLIEMGYESIMLKTQYRCHPQISADDRKPLIEGLPTLLFVDVGGTEQKSLRTNSYWNDKEIELTANIIQCMLSHNISPVELGVISLYKEQADKISEYLNESSTSTKKVQISTVDAFQPIYG